MPPAEVRAIFAWLSGELMNEGSASWVATAPRIEWPHGRWALQHCRAIVSEHRGEMMRVQSGRGR